MAAEDAIIWNNLTLNAEQLRVAQFLSENDQGHLFENWTPEEEDEQKLRLLDQCVALDKQ